MRQLITEYAGGDKLCHKELYFPIFLPLSCSLMRGLGLGNFEFVLDFWWGLGLVVSGHSNQMKEYKGSEVSVFLHSQVAAEDGDC